MSNQRWIEGSGKQFIVQMLHVQSYHWICEMLNCRLKAYYCNDFGPKNLSKYLSGISPAKRSWSRPNLVCVDMSRGWQRSGNFGRDRPILGKMGAGMSPVEPEFFLCVVNHATLHQLRNNRFSPNLVMKRTSVSRRGIGKANIKNFHFRRHLPQNLKLKV